jgi:hypothetical protein
MLITNSLQHNAYNKANETKMKRRLSSTMRSSNGLQKAVKKHLISHGAETNTRTGED